MTKLTKLMEQMMTMKLMTMTITMMTALMLMQPCQYSNSICRREESTNMN